MTFYVEMYCFVCGQRCAEYPASPDHRGDTSWETDSIHVWCKNCEPMTMTVSVLFLTIRATRTVCFGAPKRPRGRKGWDDENQN